MKSLLPFVSLALFASLFACSSKDKANEKSTTPSPDATPAPDPTFTPNSDLPGPAEWNVSVTKPADDAAAADRLSCAYAAGAMPAATQGLSRPNGDQIPVDTIVVAMMENRSFDHYFQKIRDAGIDADVAPDDFSNPDADGNPVKPYRDQTYCFVDTPHSRESVNQQIDGGKMDGFIRTAGGTWTNPVTGQVEPVDPNRVMAYYTKDDLPFTYWLAENFSIGDRYFCSAPTSTWTNRDYLFLATSFGVSHNIVPPTLDGNSPVFDAQAVSFFDYLNERQIDWKFYDTTIPTLAIIGSKLGEYQNQGHIAPIAQFHTDAANGTLPRVAFVDPDGVSKPDYLHSDEHPPALMQIGQKWLGEIVDSLVHGPQWDHSAMFITYDEHGGLYDHVVPPKACPPDEMSEDPLVKFDQYGIRVPFLVVSPFAKKKYVSHHVYDHTSILRFIEARFSMPALSGRDANAEAPWDVFDFAAPPSTDRPTVPVPEVNPALLDGCKKMWGG